MGFNLQFLDAHLGHEPMQCNDQLLMHMHQKLAQAERPMSAQLMDGAAATVSDNLEEFGYQPVL